MPSLTITGQAAGTSGTGFVVTNAPATYHDGLFTASRIQVPSSVLNVTQGWIAMRVRMGWSSSSAPNILPRGFAWQDGPGTNFIRSFFNMATQQFQIDRNGSGSLSAISSVLTFAAGDSLTLTTKWTATQLGVSINGGAFVTVSNSLSPTGLPTTFDIGDSVGTGIRTLSSAVVWFASGTGTLSDADAATINGYGNSAPLFNVVPGSPSMVWDATSSHYNPLVAVAGVTNTNVAAPLPSLNVGAVRGEADAAMSPPSLLGALGFSYADGGSFTYSGTASSFSYGGTASRTFSYPNHL